MWFGHESLKGLSCSYDATKGLLITFHDEWTCIYEIWVDPIIAGPTNPQGSEKKKKKNWKRDPSKVNQEEMSPEKNKRFVEETRNTKDGVLSFRREGCNIPLLCLEYFVTLHIVVLVSVRSSRPRPHQDNTLWLLKG